MLILAIGDLHIPYRQSFIPPKFKKLLTPGKISQVLCLGNSASTSTATHDYLRQLSPDFQQVKGQFDPDSTLPMSLIVTHGNWRIGFTNGFGVVPENDPLSLLTLSRQMNVDVLIWGGEGGKVEAYALEGKFFVNPGSATGAMGLGWEEKDEGEVEVRDEVKEEVEGQAEEKKQGQEQEQEQEENEEEDEVIPEEEFHDNIPSFTLLDIQGKTLTLFIYSYINGEVVVDKVSHRKD